MQTIFAAQLRALRRRLVGKQIALAEGIQCSQAAISQWELGRRLPERRQMHRLSAALGSAGATTAELEALRDTWWATARSRLFSFE